MQKGDSGAPAREGTVPDGDLYDLVQDLDAIVWEMDAETWRFTFVSRRAEELLGYPVEQWLTEPNFWTDQLIHPNDRDGTRESYETAIEHGRDHRFEYRAVAADGRVLWLRDVVRIVEDAEGRTQLRGVMLDITEQKRAEEALQESEQRLRSLMEGVHAILWECDAATWEFTYISRGVEQILGYPVQAWYDDGDLWTRTIHPEDRDRVVDACMEGMRAGRDSILEYRAIARDDRVVWLRDLIHVVTDEEGEPDRLQGVMVDITEQKQTKQALQEREEQLRQAQKLEAVGRLAGGIAHDFNNMLTAIQGHTELVLKALRTSDPLRADVEEIERSARRAADLTRQLLAFTRQQVLRPEVLDLNRLVGKLEAMLSRLIREDIVLETTLASALGRVEADPGQFEQVLVNLVVNARDAMPAGGRITITTRNASLTDAEATELPDPVEPGRYAVLSVSDTGTGMPPEVRQRIFEPFFTTKEQGTGLGLSTVYGIVKQSGGFVRVHSGAGDGTTFDVYLPTLESIESADSAAPGRPAASIATSAGTVLVAEDEDAVRSLVCRVLRRHGYRVLEAVHGADAVRLTKVYDGRIHLVITDVVMPELGGRELAEQLRRSRPELPVLFMSGYTDDDLSRGDAVGGPTFFLPKPFTPAALIERVRDALEREMG